METPYQQIKQRLLCGSCSAAKFMFWSWLEPDAKPHGLCEDRDTELAYLVRCDYFRLTVQSPEGLKKCEGYHPKEVRHAPTAAADPTPARPPQRYVPGTGKHRSS